MAETLWTARDVAEYLNKPVSWVYNNHQDYFRCVRVGQALRFDPDEVKAVLWGQAA